MIGYSSYGCAHFHPPEPDLRCKYCESEIWEYEVGEYCSYDCRDLDEAEHDPNILLFPVRTLTNQMEDTINDKA